MINQNDHEQNRMVSPQENSEEAAFEKSLRPKKLTDYIGQNKVKKNLEIFMQAAQKRGEPIEHVMLHGCPGLGKTTLAHIIANEMSGNIKVTTGPTIERTGDLAAILTNLEDGDILFIDEIHRLNKIIEEVLYPAMEDFALDIIIGKGPSAKTLRLDLPKFTLIGATTRMSLISAPLRDRFGATFKLDFYHDQDIETIIKRNAEILTTAIDSAASSQIAKRARKTPRVANRLLKRVRDFAEVKADGKITETLAKQALNMLEIDELGLDEIDRKILTTLITKFSGGPIGLNTLAAATNEEMESLEDVYEPFLIQLGFLNRTPRGRMATKLAFTHLGFTPKTNQNQNNLL
ncbi:MAG: Holliday junction branch migration DNA helicase RuvB [Candidatus Buchananbacteria bacterium]|nr:Holliday junction branch migration DNA helicase RuvB [Candidatus Buchananbacteria bacterium]